MTIRFARTTLALFALFALEKRVQEFERETKEMKERLHEVCTVNEGKIYKLRRQWERDREPDEVREVR